MSDKRLFLIDATAFCYRAFYALQQLSTSFGQPTNAVYGFMNMLKKILKNKKPEYLAVCFDVSRDTFRQKKFAEYKIQRPPMPDQLSSQIPLIKEIIIAYGISIFEKEGFEADDVIATLNKKARSEGLSVTIISADKDILQLVDEHTVVFSPYKDEGVLYDEKKVLARFGVTPKRIPDLITLMGDAADNIPNVPGIGEVSAVKLIKEFGSLDVLLNNLDEIKQDKLGEAIKKNLDTIRLNKELAVLDEAMDLEFDLEKIKIGKPNFQELFRLFKHLEFKKFLKDLAPLEEEAGQQGIKIEELAGELTLYGQNLKEPKKVLADPKIKKIGHDLKAIKVSLAKEGVLLEGLYFDTMLAAYLLNPSKTAYTLTDITWDYLGKGITKLVSSEEALNLIRQLRPKLEAELEEKGLSRLFKELEMPLAGVLAEMELNGIKLDAQLLKELSEELEKKLAKLIEEIHALSECSFNINSPKQLREILFEKLKLPVVKKTKTGPSTDEEVLRSLAQKHKLPAFLLEYRQLMKLKNTYVDTLPQLVDPKTGRLHTSFNQTGTETGRLSSSNPNLQNIPVKTEVGARIRQAIIAADKESLLLSCDYSQIELRLLAHLAKDENLIAAFRQDKDIHKATASLIYGLAEKDIVDAMRETAKRINFGIVYGLSAFGLSKDLGISFDEAQAFIEAYFLRYPKVKGYIQEEIEKAQKNGFVTTLLGRRRYIPEINNKNQGIRQFAQRQAVNTPIQGSAADLIKLAMLEIDKQIKEKRLKARMIMQIHDELVFDLPSRELEESAGLVRERMEKVLELAVPIRVAVKFGPNWLEMEEVK